MEIREAKKILDQIDPSKRMIDDDGRIQMAMQLMGRFEEAFKIVNGESIKKTIFLTEKEAAALKKAFYAQPIATRPIGKPTREEAETILKSHTTPSGKVILDDIEGNAALQVINRSCEVMAIMEQNPHFSSFDYLSPKEVKVLKKIAAATGKAKRKETVKKPSIWKRLFKRSGKPSFWKRLFHKEEKPRFDWRNPLNWRDVNFPAKDGDILFSHRLNVSRLTPEQREAIKAELAQAKINITERRATRDNGDIREGDLTFRVADKESIERLRDFVFNWAHQPGTRPVSMSEAEFNQMQEKKKALTRTPVGPSKEAEKPVISHAVEGKRPDPREGSR